MQPEPISELEDLFFRQKPARLLIHIKNGKQPYASTLAKKIDCTYAHTTKLIAEMEKHGLVSFKESGRVKFIEITTRGADLAEHFENLIFRKMNVGK